MIITGMVAMMLGVISLGLEEKRQVKKDIAFYQLLDDIHKELKGLRGDTATLITKIGGNNEHTDTGNGK